MRPILGLTDQVTAALPPVTVAENCWIWPADNVPFKGETEIETVGDNVIVAASDLVESAWLVAVTVSVC